MVSTRRDTAPTRDLVAAIAWMDGFDLDAARSGDLYRRARLALLRLRAQRTYERTDASVREVRAALADASRQLRELGQMERPARKDVAHLPLAVCNL